ncbi:MAG: HesB/IscA family protein [Alphaproteobacteria bacterium]
MTQIIVSESALSRIREVKSKQQNQNKFLRIAVSSGGCSGFQYIFSLDDKIQDDDLLVYSENSENFVVTDSTSMQFLEGSQLDFVSELGAQYFKVSNPNAKANCGCGSSFAI